MGEERVMGKAKVKADAGFSLWQELRRAESEKEPDWLSLISLCGLFWCSRRMGESDEWWEFVS